MQSRAKRWLFNASLLGVLALGVGMAISRAYDADARMRGDLLRQASLIASAFGAELIESLAGDLTDEQNPRYIRVKQQLTVARTLYPDVRFVYLTRLLPDGRVIFLADSENPESPDYSYPGQIYEEATDKHRLLFIRPRAIAEGPVRDRWGVWVSALAPIQDRLSGQVVAVLGADVDAARWIERIAVAAVMPIVLSIVLMLMMLYFRRRLRTSRSNASGERSMLNTETRFALCFGLVLTFYAILHARHSEEQRRHVEFMRKAVLHARAAQDFFTRIGNSYLRSIAQFVANSDSVTRGEFSGFVEYLIDRPYALYWGYLPWVRADDRAAYEEAAKRTEDDEIPIWEWGPQGERRAAPPRDEYAPLQFAVSARDHIGDKGFDHASDPKRLEAILRAAETDLPEATEPIDLIIGDESERVVMLYHRVTFARAKVVQGFAVVALRINKLLVRLVNPEIGAQDATMEFALCMPDAAGQIVTLAPGGAHASESTSWRSQPRALLLAPIFVFGRTFVIAAQTAESGASYAAAAMRNTAAVGCLLTGLLAALVLTLTRRRAELERLVNERTAELRASESSYHGLFNSIRQAIYIQDRDGRFLDVNEGAVNMYGFTREEFIGRTPDFLSAPVRNDMEEIHSRIRRAWSGDPQVFEFWGRRKNGEIFPKTVSLYKGMYFGKEVLIAVAADITERKQAEDQQAKLQAQLQQAQKLESIGRLAGGIAHDFNNMLQAILGNAMLAIDETTESRVRDYLTEIKRSAERSADLTRQLLAFASRQPVNPRVIDLNDAIAGMLKMLRRLLGEDIHLRWNPGPNLGPVRIDPIQIDQILANLTVNARDAIDGVGTITIETWPLAAGDDALRKRYDNCPPGEFSCLRVADTGRGMDDHTRAHIFEPFYTTKPEGKGVGLGLATVFGIVKQNNGFIHVESELGKGSSFVIGFPRAPQTVAKETNPGVADRAVGGQETILLVEDEESVLRFCENSLRNLGYTVLAESRPDRAIERVQRHEGPIHLLVTDLVMPGMNGRQLANCLAELRPEMKVLYMSGYTADIIATRGVLHEGVIFLHKPFRSDLLAAKVREALDAPSIG